jgi:hypothetical protein
MSYVFTPNLAQALSSSKFRKAIGATSQGKVYPATHPNILNFVPGMLSKHVFDLWMSGTECDKYTCLVYRFQFSCQNADREGPTEKFWLDDGGRQNRDNLLAGH